MTDAELRDAAVAELEFTTVGYLSNPAKGGCKHDWILPPGGTHWANGLDLLAQIGKPLPPPPPPPGSAWAWDARNAPLDPNSAALMATFLTYAVKSPNVCLTSWAVATCDAKDGDPEYPVPLSDGGTLDPLIRIPLGTQPDPSGDGHLTVRDVGRGREHDFWQAKYDPVSRRIKSASSGVSFPLGQVSEPNGWAGDAACTPLRRGLITPEAIRAGAITETMQFSTPQIGPGAPRFPAVHNAPTGPAGHLVEGTWLRLDPTLRPRTLGLPSWEVTIAEALQAHGMILRDNGGTMSLYGQNRVNEPGGNQAWVDAGFTGSSASFSAGFPWPKLQILQPPPA